MGRSTASYSWFGNCQRDAFATATRTLQQRIDRFGASSTAVSDWLRGQDAVFANCAGTDIVLPPAPASREPLMAADQEYQTAAAYFYATRYEEAGARFKRIAAEPQGYLAEEAVKWARATPSDPRAAEALALAVEGGRWSCAVGESSRRAFQTLHRLFPKSDWARRTKYWYEPHY